MKILPMQSRGIVLMHEDGKTIEMAPMQVFRQRNGNTIIRIGRNTLHFLEDGTFDGEECACSAGAKQEEIVAALQQSAANQGQPPETTYFEEGTRGWEDETAGRGGAQKELREGRWLWSGRAGRRAGGSRRGQER